MTNVSQTHSKTLRQLLAKTGVRMISGDQDLAVTGVVADSRQVDPGSLFIAVKGEMVDGHDYLDRAVKRGCAAVVVEQGCAVECYHDLEVPVLEAGDGRRAIAQLAAEFYDHPEQQLKLIGITGTNGKTTTSYLIEKIIAAAGGVVGVIGTVSYRYKTIEETASFTTPEPTVLYRLMREMVDGGVDHLIMEVSSHALIQNRLHGIVFDLAVFTNLSHEHLDFHGEMEDYFAAKRLLFEEHLKDDGMAVVMLSDEENSAEQAVAWGDRLVESLVESGLFSHPGDESEEGILLLTCGRNRGDIHLGEAEISLEGIRASAIGLGEDLTLYSPLVGDFNLLNMATAMGVGHILGISAEQIGRGIAETQVVPGRLERVRDSDGRDFDPGKCRVFVDFAHTPEALSGVIQSVRPLCKGRLVVLFGCGGDRDRTKRPVMGEIAGRLADVVIITSDNSRSEEPVSIMAEIENGLLAGDCAPVTRQRAAELLLSGTRGYDIIESRSEAISTAIRNAAPEDVILICGKGHETYQIIGSTRYFFDDRLEAAKQLAGMTVDRGLK
jgi:UDP-N-acetylmuramyl-tripeptide synthetase